MQMHFDEASFEVPCEYRTVVSSCEDLVGASVVDRTHDIVSVGTRVLKILVGQITSHIYVLFFALTIIKPNSEAAVPAGSHEVRWLFDLLLIFFILVTL